MRRAKHFFSYKLLRVLVLGSVLVIITLQFQLKKVIVIAPRINNIHLEILNNKNLLFLNVGQIKRSILANNMDIKSLTIKKIFPQTLELDYILRDPKAILSSPHGYKLLSEDGIIISQQTNNEQNLHVIETSSLNINSNNDWRLLKALTYLKLLTKLDISVNKIIQEDDLSVYKIFLGDNSEIIIPQNADPYLISPSLQLIIYRFRIEGKFISIIDFSYDKPVVTFKNGGKTLSLE